MGKLYKTVQFLTDCLDDLFIYLLLLLLLLLLFFAVGPLRYQVVLTTSAAFDFDSDISIIDHRQVFCVCICFAPRIYAGLFLFLLLICILLPDEMGMGFERNSYYVALIFIIHSFLLYDGRRWGL